MVMTHCPSNGTVTNFHVLRQDSRVVKHIASGASSDNSAHQAQIAQQYWPEISL
jgi:hypothetical protein